MKPTSIVLVSGGLDSCVTAAIACQQSTPAFLHINYGQRTEKRELQSFNDLADYYKVKNRLVVDITHLRKIGGSSLTDTSISVAKADLENKEIPTSYVPFRNANILTIATSWAETIAAAEIYIGAMEEDSSGYPDCRRIFYDAFEKTIALGTKYTTNIKIVTPIIQLKKSEVIEKGNKLKAPFHLTWSCYQDEKSACGVCDSCAFRLRGFQQLGLEDPLPYKELPGYI